jgi:AcrR family transcriptional regulator
MKPRYHHGNLAAAIIALARARLREAPSASLSLRDLARELGVSPNAPYRHFPGKGGVTAALVAEGYRELTSVAEAAAGADRPAAVLASGYARFAVAEPALLRLLNEEDFSGRDPSSEVVLARDEWFAGLVGVVEAESKALPAGEAYRRAAAVWSILIGVTQLAHYGARGLLLEELLPDSAQLLQRIARGG